MKEPIDYDKIIKDFFARVRVFLENTPDAPYNAGALNHNISCMFVFGCNPAKFTQKDEIKVNDLFITSAGMGDRLFQVVDKMIAVARSYYNASVEEPVAEQKIILDLDKKAKIFMLKRNPIQTIELLLSKNKIR